jgi:hypothetical protein
VQLPPFLTSFLLSFLPSFFLSFTTGIQQLDSVQIRTSPHCHGIQNQTFFWF